MRGRPDVLIRPRALALTACLTVALVAAWPSLRAQTPATAAPRPPRRCRRAVAIAGCATLATGRARGRRHEPTTSASSRLEQYDYDGRRAASSGGPSSWRRTSSWRASTSRSPCSTRQPPRGGTGGAGRARPATGLAAGALRAGPDGANRQRARQAAEAFRRVLAIDPDDVGANIGLGQVLLQQRKFDEAVALFDAAARAEPFNLTASYNLAFALTRAGRAEEGRAAMTRFQTLRETGNGLGYTNNYLEQGRYAEALVSTGLEPGFVSRQTPAVSFELSRLETRAGEPAPASGAAGASPACRRWRIWIATVTSTSWSRARVVPSPQRRGTIRAVARHRRRTATCCARPPERSSRTATTTVRPTLSCSGGRGALFVAGSARPLPGQDREERDRAAEVAPQTAALADVDHDGDSTSSRGARLGSRCFATTATGPSPT